MDALNTGQTKSKLLPDNAYRKLEPGEEYRPIVPPEDKRAEVTLWSIGLGVVMVVVFTAACAYISLRAGNGIEASIPIAILAIFFGMARKVKTTILENVMVQSVGQASGVVAAGATFVVPALYINQLEASWWQIFLACTVGGMLGVVLIIPLRKYFVKDLHGELPFPEATAINEVLVTGESSAGGAGKILIAAFLLGAVFDFMIEAGHLWNAHLSTSALPMGLGEYFDSLRIEVQIAGIAALFGLGYIIGVKYASIIAAGSVLAYVILVPLVYQFGKYAGSFAYAGQTFDLATMSSSAIFASFIKPIGIGAIAISGLIGIARMWKIVAGSITLGFKGLKKGGADKAAQAERTQLDMAPGNVLKIQLLATIGMGLFFFLMAMITKEPNGAGYGVGDSVIFALVGMIAGFLLSFLFTPVAAQAIAIVGVNPVSGMTLITVVLAIGALILVGLSGTAGMIIALVVGTAVCTALSTSGALISDFKVGYWIGATPRNQERWKFLGIVVAALVVALVIPLMDEAYQFLIKDPSTGLLIPNDKVLPAPQGNMIAAVSKGLMADPANQPWVLYGLGGLVAVLLLMAGVPMLAFALGMYLPISINMAVLAGAVCAWIIARTGGSEGVRKARAEQGLLIASGLMAGAAIFGILTAVLRLPAVGAPIRSLSVGVEYRLEAVVDGSVVEKDGKVIGSCADVALLEGQKCNELLRPVPFQKDEKGNPVYDDDVLAEAKTRLSAIVGRLEGISVGDDQMAAHRRKKAVTDARALANTVARLADGEAVGRPVYNARGLVSSTAVLKGVVAVRAQTTSSAAGDAVTEVERARVSAEQTGTAEAKKALAAAESSAASLKVEAEKARKDRLAMEEVVKEVVHVDRHLHPKEVHAWYEGGLGSGLGLLMLFLLGYACYLLARKGAMWQLEHDNSQE